ncbi:MAG: N-6 DNA methylase [Acidimicrobiales bacterium]
MADDRALVVARRAASLAAAGGIDLPDDLALWALASGRPDAAPQPGEPEELGALLERTTGRRTRRRLGVHFTPGGLARDLVARAIDGHVSPTIGDPACGGGALLLACARQLVARGEPWRDVHARLWGRDVDALAVATCEAALALWAGGAPVAGRCTVGDALLEEGSWPALDVVVGNPPFLSPLSESTARPAGLAERLRGRFGDAVGPYTDAAALFLLAACREVRPGGTVALIQPVSVLTNRDAAAVRAAVERLATVREVWVPSGRAFDAAVDVCVPILDRDVVDGSGGRADRPAGAPATAASWASHLTGPLGVPAVDLGEGSGMLGDRADVMAAFRTEYYGTVPHVHEADDLPEGRPLLTSGAIDLGGTAWGGRSARVGGRRWIRPVVDVSALEGRAAQWVARTAGPKLVVATQTKVVELAVDEDGCYVASVPLVVVRPEAGQLWHAAAALASPAVSAWLFQRSAGSGLSPGALRISAPVLRSVPLPVDRVAWDRGAQAFRARDIDAFIAAMEAAYAVDPEVGAWWKERATSVWSTGGPRR